MLVMLTIVAGSVAGADARDRSAADRRAMETGATVQRGSRSFSAAGYTVITEPGPGDIEYEIDAVVWLPDNKAKGTDCFAFDIDRTATETTITASCDPGQKPKRGKLMATFDVSSIVWEGNSGTGVDSCRDRHNMRKNTVFTCTVQNPETLP